MSEETFKEYMGSGEIPRVITDREIFDTHFLTKWKECIGMALHELDEICIGIKGLTYTMADVLSATAQLFIAWNQNEGRIENLKKQLQDKLDKIKPIIKKEKGV